MRANADNRMKIKHNHMILNVLNNLLFLWSRYAHLGILSF